MIDLHPDHLEAAYEFLTRFEPFKSWGLPPSEEVIFSVRRSRDAGSFNLEQNKTPHIMLSMNHIGRIRPLLTIMAHEMIHQYQYQQGTNTKHYHNAEFKALSKEICDIHGWDYLLFV